jgi:two-component system, LuxR family, response regulator FixJ
MPKHCVLIIDDDRGAVDAFEPMLTSRGYTVQAALDAEHGMRAIDESIPSAIVLDLHFPTISGIEFLQRLRSNVAHAAIPVAVVTGDYLLEDRVSAELDALGARLFFKPLWEEDLVQIVEGLLASRHCACLGSAP